MLSEKRQGRVTGSNAGAILGLDPNRTRYDVMRAMVREYHSAEKEIDEFAESTIFAYGHLHESGARAEFEMETGLSVQECGFFIHPEYDWLGATPDGLVGDDAVFEAKCPWGLRDKAEPEFKAINELPHYYARVQIEMACAGRTKAHFYQWAPNGTAHEPVTYSAEWFAQALPALQAFYNDYLKEREHPEQYLEPRRLVVENEEASRLLAEYDDLLDVIDRADERKEEVMQRLVEMAKGKNAEVCGRLLTKVERQGAVSYAAVVKKYCKDVDLDQFRGKSYEYWKLS